MSSQWGHTYTDTYALPAGVAADIDYIRPWRLRCRNRRVYIDRDHLVAFLHAAGCHDAAHTISVCGQEWETP